MNQNFKRKLMAGLLSACMIFQTAGIVPVYAAENAADNIVTLAVEEVYAVYDGGTFYAATADAPTVPTTPEKVISDKKTINHLYIMGASVPKELMLQSTGLTSVAMPSATTIGFQAFDGCTGLASVAMPSAITIDGFAFSSCTGLTSVAMPNATGIGKYAFLGCTGLTSAQLPKVTTIGDNAFSDCINLASVEMPSATSIGNMAFSNCQKLAKLTLGATPPATVGTDVFKSCPASRTLTIPGSLDSQAVAVVKYKAVNDGNTGDELWYGWTLPSITPSAGTLEITAGNSNPAYGTNNIITLTATFDKATNIGKQRASTINKVEFKDGATSLGTATANATQNVNGKLVATLNVDTKNWAVGAHSLTATFAGNEELVGSTTNTMTVTVNEVYAVYNGSKFCAATVDAPTVPTTTEISDTDKNTINHLYIMGASVPKNLMLNCTNLKTVNCADTVTTIDIYAFSGCTSLTSVEMPAVITININAFYGCTKLTRAAMPSATSIGGRAFYDCTSLTSVEMPAVTTIGEYAFYNCTTLASLTLGATPPATVSTDAFTGCPTSRTLTIQGNTADQTAVLANYKAAADGDTTDDKWWGWTLPTSLDGTGLSKSAGTLAVTTGNAAPSFGTDNAITLTATFDKATKANKLRTLAINQVEFKDGTTALGAIANATQNTDGKWVATLNVNTKDWTVGAHKLTAEYAGNHELGGSTTNEATVTVNANEVYAVYDGSSGKFYRATQAAPSTATAEEIASTDKTTITNLYIMGESVPNALMGDSGVIANTTLKTVTCANTVTTIGNQAFYKCRALTSVEMPKVNTIGAHAFYECAGLESVELPNATSIGINAFYYCESLTSAKLPKVTSISVSAFYGCAKLASVEMPGATSIGTSAFRNCTGLTSVEMPNVTSSIGESAFYGCAKLSSVAMPNVTSIGTYAFYNCKGLTSVAMPNVTEIGEWAFVSCTKLASVEMPKVTTIGDKAFYGTALTSVSLPSVTTIGINAFEGCTGLTSVEMPKATKIVSYAFNGCTGFASLTLGATPPTVAAGNAFLNCPTSRTLTIQCNTDSQADAVAAYKAVEDGNTGDELWYGWTLPKIINEIYAVYDGSNFCAATKADPTTATSEEITDKKTINHLYIMAASVPDELMLSCTNLKTVTCANTVTEIGYAAFGQCTGLTSVAMPNVAKIGNYAFKDCAGLTSVEMPNVTSIGDYAFAECTSLVSAVMPKVTTIGQYAFHNCTSLTSVAMPEVTTIGNNAFYKCTGLASVEMPMVTSIGNYAFQECKGLKSANLPKATTIGEQAFNGCTSLASAALPEATSLDNRVFSGCIALTSAQLPKVTTIGLEAFYNCTTLASLTLGATPPTVGKDAFSSCPKTNGLTIQGNTAFKDTVLAAYKAEADGNLTDELWYGWTLPNSLDSTGVSTSEGKLTAAGSVTVNYGTDNTITFTASFAKVGENKLKTLAENQISLLKDGVVVESKAATQKDGVYSAEFTVNTKDFTAGTYSYTATFDGNRNLVSSTATETVTVTINKIDQAVLNISEVPNKTYGDSTFTLSTTGGSGDGAVTYAVTAGDAVSVVGSTGVVTVLKAGTATITATKAGDTNYNAKTGTAQITVATATPTLTWGNAIQTVTYTGSAAVITAPTATGVTGGATPTGTISYTYEKKSVSSLFTTPENGLPVNAGTYTVTAHIAAAGNYTAADSATMELTIEKSTPTLAISTMNGKTYDGTAVANPAAENMTISGTNYADVKFAYSKNSNMSNLLATAPKDAGTYYVQASVVAGANTNAASSTAVSFTIAQAALTVSGGTVTQRQYNGGTGAAVTALTLNGLVNGETLALTTDYTVGAPAYNNADAGTNKTVTGTATLVSNAKTNNYTLTGAYTITGQTINKATGLAAPTDSAMDDKANTFTFTPVTNYADVTAYEYSMDGGTTWTNVSANPISVGNVAGTIKIRIKATTNYEAGAVYTHSAAFTATLEGTVAIGGTATYGEILTATASGTQAGAVLSYKWLAGTTELQSGTSNTLKIPGSAVGKTITVEVTAAGYEGKLTSPATNAVAKKAVTATAGTVSKVYDGTAAVETTDRTLTITKVNGSDDITITAANAVYNDANVNTNKAITLGDLSISGAAAGWYTVTAPIGVTGTITAKPVTVKADDKSMTTGGTLPTFTVTYTGFVGTENDSNAALTTPAVATCTADGKTAGSFDITLSTQAVLNGTIGKNYTITSQTTGTLTVSSPSSGGGTVTPPAPKPEPPKTDPGTGNTEVSVPVKPVTKGDTSSATVPETAVSDAIAAAEKEAAKTGGSSSVTVTVDAPEGAKTVETTLSGKSLSAVADGKTEGLKISTPVADLSFDSEALKNIAGMAGKDVKISATQVDTKSLTDAQKSQVGDAPVFDFTVTSGDKTISNFNGGTATVSVPYTPKEGENPEFVTVWLLDDAGKLIPIEASYKDGKIAFETGHFSRYAIGYLPFTDVKADWAYESIVYVYQNKLFSGVGDDKFAPTANMNRAMLWTVLYRMAGSPGKTETPANWYADAQAWAIANGISDGTNPDGNITREQLATILFRYAKAAATAADMSGFTDTNEISSFAKDGMSWAVESAILQGNSGKLNPAGNATRAEVAAVLSRYVELVIDKATA